MTFKAALMSLYFERYKFPSRMTKFRSLQGNKYITNKYHKYFDFFVSLSASLVIIKYITPVFQAYLKDFWSKAVKMQNINCGGALSMRICRYQLKVLLLCTTNFELIV